MGNCMSSDDSKSNYATYFSSDLILYENPEVLKPLPTSLFNTLRKPAECAIVTGNSSSLSQEVDILCINFKNATPNSLKTLLNFKKIVYIGQRGGQGQAEIQKVRTHVSYSKFYIVSEISFRQFLTDFPIFSKKNWAKHDMAPNKLPLMLVDSKQFVRAINNRIRLFVHASSKMNAQVYALLGIKKESMMIKQPPTGSTVERTKGHYADALGDSKENIIVMLHSQSMSANDILQTVATVLQDKYKISYKQSQTYLKKNWPNSNFTHDKPATIIVDPVAKTDNVIENSVDRFKKYFQKLQGQSSVEKAQRAYNLLSTLIINIYSNANEDSYRQVKRTNRQMNDLLIKHKYGLKLLDELGFREKEQHWVNTVQTKYLKIYKTDLDLGFKRYKSKEQQ